MSWISKPYRPSVWSRRRWRPPSPACGRTRLATSRTSTTTSSRWNRPARPRRPSTGCTASSKEERDIVIESPPLEATAFQVENIRMAYVFYESGLSINVMYTSTTPKKRAVGFKLSDGMDVPAELAKRFKFATPEVEAGRNDPRFVLRDQGRILSGDERALPIAEDFFKRLLHGTDPLEAVGTLSDRWGVRAKSTGPWLGLSRPEHQVSMALIYVGEVGNGGHTQFFSNRGGEIVARVHAALRDVGLVELGAILGERLRLLSGRQGSRGPRGGGSTPRGLGRGSARRDRSPGPAGIAAGCVPPSPRLPARAEAQSEVLRPERGLDDPGRSRYSPGIVPAPDRQPDGEDGNRAGPEGEIERTHAEAPCVHDDERGDGRDARRPHPTHVREEPRALVRRRGEPEAKVRSRRVPRRALRRGRRGPSTGGCRTPRARPRRRRGEAEEQGRSRLATPRRVPSSGARARRAERSRPRGR